MPEGSTFASAPPPADVKYKTASLLSPAIFSFAPESFTSRQGMSAPSG
jgi:hypothetical protein